MTFKDIYDSVIPVWGEQIGFSDGMLLEAKPSKKAFGATPAAAANFFSPALSKYWNEVEETIGKENTYADLMVWTMYQIFHRHARQLFEQGTFSLNPTSIAKSEIEAQYFHNLQEDAWAEELAHYERTIE